MPESAQSEIPKVVVTGIGLVHRLGIGIDPFWSAIMDGKSGIHRITSFDTEGYTSKIGSEIPEGALDAIVDAKVRRNFKGHTLYSLAAAKLAVQDAKLAAESVQKDRAGVFVGSGMCELNVLAENFDRLDKRPGKVSPFMIPACISNTIAGLIGIEMGFCGPNFAVVSACATGSHNIGEALHLMRRGEADVMLAGGAESGLTPIGLAGFCSMRALSTHFNDEPERACRPFDAKRDGFVLGNGAAIVLLETEAHAKQRGARIYCELAGYGATCDAYHITAPAPEGRGLAKAIENTLQMAKVAPEQVQYINAHGTSTKYNDAFETAAIKSVFGTHAHKLMVSSTKSMTSHIIGGAGSLEAGICAKTIAEGKVAPTINYENPDAECDLNYVPNKAQEAKVEFALSNSLGFGGQNAALLLRAYHPTP